MLQNHDKNIFSKKKVEVSKFGGLTIHFGRAQVFVQQMQHEPSHICFSQPCVSWGNVCTLLYTTSWKRDWPYCSIGPISVNYYSSVQIRNAPTSSRGVGTRRISINCVHQRIPLMQSVLSQERKNKCSALLSPSQQHTICIQRAPNIAHQF